MIIKVSKSCRMQNMFEVWSSVLTYVMTTGRLVGGSVGRWSVGLWSVDLIKPAVY